MNWREVVIAALITLNIVMLILFGIEMADRISYLEDRLYNACALLQD